MRVILTQHCLKTGEVFEIPGHAPLRVVMHPKYDRTRRRFIEEPRLEFDKPERRR